MSWSFSALGKPSAVLAKAEKEFGVNRCAEPEESIRQAALGQIKLALEAFPPKGFAVKVSANGSQSVYEPGCAVNSFSLTIEQVYGFIE